MTVDQFDAFFRSRVPENSEFVVQPVKSVVSRGPFSPDSLTFNRPSTDSDPMSRPNEFDDLNVLIPGYSVEDLPTDLEEDAAASLLNAFAIAWHPLLLCRISGLPLFRHADSFHQMSGRQILIVPSSTDGWLPHDWKQDADRHSWITFADCRSREEYLASICQQLPPRDGDALPVLADEFMAFGTAFLLVRLLSRRMHHFVDPDEGLLSREIHLAADASVSGNLDQARLHLQNCFNQLRETRERFYPLNCYLVDLCVPSAQSSPLEIEQVVLSSSNLNLIATTHQISSWIQSKSELGELLKDRAQLGSLCLMSGHSREVRTVLSSLSALVDDLQLGSREFASALGIPPRHWARRRFGLTASLPTVLRHFGYRSAFHVALDDGLYPDKERSQFDWMSNCGDFLPATSRIPLAVDSAASVLRLADRYNESMQDDTVASLLLARLPALRTPWLADLRIIAGFSPVLGEFVTLENLFSLCSAYRTSLKFDEGEYLSPVLIQSAVLGLEAPVSGPAALHRLHQKLDRVSALQSLCQLAKCSIPVSLASVTDQLRIDILDQEVRHCEPDPEPQPENLTTSTESNSSRITKLFGECSQLETRIATLEQNVTGLLAERLSNPAAQGRALFIVNSLPLSRVSEIAWPQGWNPPAKNPAIEAWSTETAGATSGGCLLVRLPPGGFVWLNEASDSRDAQSEVQRSRRDIPLADELLLQNQYFTLAINERTGGIASLRFRNTRLNRFSQMLTFRFEREQLLPAEPGEPVERTNYAVPVLTAHRAISDGPLFGIYETSIDIVSPSDGRLLASCRQIITIDRIRPLIRLKIVFDAVHETPRGNPWLTYFGCRFAWENESAALTRGILGQAAGFAAERCESPDYFEVADDEARLLVVPMGRPWHRKSGPRMMDSLLIVENEPEREFEFLIDLDQDFPMRSVSEAMNPPIVQQIEHRLPKLPSAWLLGVTARNVCLARMESAIVNREDDGRNLEVQLWLLETEGVAADCLVKLARLPISASLINGENQTIRELAIDAEGVSVKLDRFELRVVKLVYPIMSESRNIA